MPDKQIYLKNISRKCFQKKLILISFQDAYVLIIFLRTSVSKIYTYTTDIPCTQ